jgi:hypothetical protein
MTPNEYDLLLTNCNGK